MKKNFLFLLLLFAGHILSAQLIKDIGRGIKRDAEYRVERKARDAVKTGIDSLEKKAKNKKEKKDENNSGKGTTTDVTKEKKGEAPEAGEGFITLKLSTQVTTIGLSVTISGESIKYGKWNSVKVMIKYLGLQGSKIPENEDEVSVALNDSSKYSLVWDKLFDEGDYLIIAVSSDGKAKASEKLWVMDWYQPQDETKDLMDATGEAFHRLKEKAYDLQPLISHKDMTALLAKVNEARERLDALHKFLNSLKKAKKEIGDLLKSGKAPSKNIRENLALLTEMIVSKTGEIKKINDIVRNASAYSPARLPGKLSVTALFFYLSENNVEKHRASENTICEYIAILNEACAAFSTITNGWTKTLGGVIKNIILDKGVPKATEKILNAAVPEMNSQNDIGGDGGTFAAKEASKIFAAAKFDAEGLTSKLGKAGIAGDVVQFATDVLMKVHCGVFKGKLTHNYTFFALNEQGKKWWIYQVKNEAAIVLRYPKSSNGIIKMKGTIEGNATDFYFHANPDLNPDYKAGTAGKVETMVLKNYTPFTLGIASSLHDELGFGMVARGIATPAYFLIPVEAEYNTTTEKIKLLINDAWIDYSAEIINMQSFVQWGAGLPKLRLTQYPISKARLTINATLKEKNEFIVKKDAKGNLFIEENVQRNIGEITDERQHFLITTISAKKE